MKPIKLVIIGIFVLSGVLIALLLRQKIGRIDEQLSKKEMGWNPVAIKKMVIIKPGQDSIILTKADGIWKSNKKFDASGAASQILLYLSTLQIENSVGNQKSELMVDAISLQSIDKNQNNINTLLVGKNVSEGVCVARLNDEATIKLLSNSLNSKSLRTILDTLL